MSALNKLLLIILLIFNLLNPFVLKGQEGKPTDSISACPEHDLPEILRSKLHLPAKEKKENAQSLILLPTVQTNPSIGFAVGFGGQYAFKNRASNNYSMLFGSMQYTTKHQFIFMLKNNIYTPNDKIFLNGDWRYLVYSQSTYGLGTNAPVGGVLDFQYNIDGMETSLDSLAQPMTFNFARLHQAVGFRIQNNMYLGLGYKFDSYTRIKDKLLRLNPGDSLITSHYAYNTRYHFDKESYYNSALSATFVIDKRDNMIQAYKGYYLSVNWQGGFKFTGNERTSNLVNVEWRSFHSLSATNPAHLIAFWFMGDFAEQGSLPYMILPATAYDQRGRSARGYTQGRFRGNCLTYGEAEYRFPISPCGGILGGVVFANATSANNPFQNLELLESIKSAVGAGLRIKIDKYSRTNLAVDLAYGDRSLAFYLAASETF